jgi:hypothetical protein
MTDYSPILENVGELIRQHLPQEIAVPVFTAGPVALAVFGLGMAVLGAKLSRFALTVAFGVVGVGLGIWVCQRADFSMVVGAPVGAIVFGVVGFALRRLWIGAIAAAMLVSIATGGYGYRAVLPHVESIAAMPDWVAPGAGQDVADTLGFSKSAGTSTASSGRVSSGKYVVPDEQTQQAHLNPAFTDWLDSVWTKATASDVNLKRNMLALAGGVGLFGLLVGLMAPRLTVVLLTSVVGTSMLISGLTAAARHWYPETYEASIQHPQALGVGCSLFLVGSLVLQFLLTRPDKAKAPPAV